MSRAVLIMGPSGGGKSHSIQYLDPESTFIINVLSKDLPWKGSGKQYTIYNKKSNPDGNLVNIKHTEKILSWMRFISEERPEIKDLIIDDHTHIYAGYYLEQSKIEEKAIANKERPNIYRKFTDIAMDTKDIADLAKNLRKDLTVYVMHHTDETGDGVMEAKMTKAASFGKFVEERLKGIESQFTVVLLAEKKFDKDKKITGVFITNDVNSTAKSPSGMFETIEVPNNLQKVRNALDCYYDGNCN